MAKTDSWKPHESLTQAPTNLKEAIDWVLRVTGKDGKKNEAAKPASTSNGPHCLCYLAKAVKDLLYDAKDPGSPGPSTDRYWDDLLLTEERTIVNPVLQDLGLVHSGSTSAASSTCAGGTEVIGTLIEQLALGLQKWVGWQDTGDDCCLKGTSGKSKGIGKACERSGAGVGATCCTSGGSGSHGCSKCGTSGGKKCYLSAYCKATSPPSSFPENYLWTSISSDSDKVHLLARIFLGSVCLIWSGLSQLGFLTGGSSRWKDSKLHDISAADQAGLGSFMAAMGYDLERLNQGSPPDKKGGFVQELLTDKSKGVSWLEFTKGADNKSVAEYYSSIYDKAKEALKKDNKTESICNDYPLLVLHILASGYFRAGSAGAKGVTPPGKPASGTPSATDTKKDTAPRKPRTIREILYWLSALPYSKGYRDLVGRMDGKMKDILPKDDQKKPLNEQKLTLESTEYNKSTELKRDCITHYLLAACGYCPLVLIGIQGTIATSGTESAPAVSGVVMWSHGVVGPAAAAAAEKKKCPEHAKDRNKRCKLDEKDKTADTAAKTQPDPKLQRGEVCYGGYHLDVSLFGPLHGMYANGLFGFQMDGSPAQCLDQLRVYVYHCFYQLYFLRKQCSTGAIAAVGAGAAGKTVLGWKSCRYGSGVNSGRGVSISSPWLCKTEGSGAGKDCNCKKNASNESPLMAFLCDALGSMACKKTIGKSSDSETNPYPSIEDHMNKSVDSNGKEQDPHGYYPQLCPVPMGWSAETPSSSTSGGQVRVNHFKGTSQYSIWHP
eukprot:XP_001609449.1 variant erythrocyte surface antigen-1, beta subunit [Babesia bovis T2Bo]